MKTVADFISARCSLQVTCCNCSHDAYIAARALKGMLGFTAKILDAKFKCSRCQSENVRLKAAPDHLAENKLAKMSFGGVYEKYTD